MPHVFDHTPTVQEIFDEACRFFATSEGPSAVICRDVKCKYRHPTLDRCCGAGHFIPDDSYRPDMDDSNLEDPKTGDSGTMLHVIMNVFGGLLPSWFPDRIEILQGVQGIHDDTVNWDESKPNFGWNYRRLAVRLEAFAFEWKLDNTAVEQVRERSQLGASAKRED